jgi:hypothetical protein
VSVYLFFIYFDAIAPIFTKFGTVVCFSGTIHSSIVMHFAWYRASEKQIIPCLPCMSVSSFRDI